MLHFVRGNYIKHNLHKPLWFHPLSNLKFRLYQIRSNLHLTSMIQIHHRIKARDDDSRTNHGTTGDSKRLTGPKITPRPVLVLKI